MVKEVDDRVQEVFASAYADTAREFEQLFARLFPGGQGSLVLTEPDDMLATGIEIEARPPGKKVKRLSLLSGGERSLTAIAYLFAIFKARPSPFYVLDEVEAALDDTNLQRLLGVFDELRESSQLIVITHQRRTMEAADALYGITHARRRRLHRDQPAPNRTRTRLTPPPPRPQPRDPPTRPHQLGLRHPAACTTRAPPQAVRAASGYPATRAAVPAVPRRPSSPPAPRRASPRHSGHAEATELTGVGL